MFLKYSKCRLFNRQKMAENELKVGAGLFEDTRALKFLISHISTELISFRFSFRPYKSRN